MSFDIGKKPNRIPGGIPLVGPERSVPGGSIHDTHIIGPNGNIYNPHLTWTPDGGPRQGNPKGHIW
jgi:hypothetical protein